MDDVPLEKCGCIKISVYKSDKENGKPVFSIESDNDDLFDIEYIIEDLLKMY
ncbi:MAG: hypothetical protein IKG42_01800 [Clostridia bacterium]|nr:hypothetical protein [Clostridia bacterium]